MSFSIQNMKVSKRLMLLIAVAATVFIVQAIIGLYQMSVNKTTLSSIYDDRMKPVDQLSDINKYMLENRTYLTTVLINPDLNATAKTSKQLINAEIANKSADAIERNFVTIAELWKAYMATTLTPEEKILAEKFANSYEKIVNEALKPAVTSIRVRDYVGSKRLAGVVAELYVDADKDIEALIKLQFDVAEEVNKAADTNYTNMRLLTFLGLAAAVAVLFWLGLLVTRSIIKPLEKSISVFGQIGEGNFETPIEAQGDDELSKVLQSLKAMQAKLSQDIGEKQVLAAQVADQSALYEGQLAAISKSTGVIEFSMDGKVIAANDIFLNVLGYSLAEVLGQHHSTFVGDAYRTSAEYKALWEKLNRAQSMTGEFQRFGKNAKEIWIQASYNPILDGHGKPYKVVKYATDITEQKIKNADFAGQINAIGKSQGVIELGLDGSILKVNETYLQMLGYAEHELLGKPVTIVLDPTFAKSAAYTELWTKLVSGNSEAGQYKRIAKSGKEVWIQASYNPIFDLNGKPYKIVNYTIDITEQKLQAAENAGQIAAISKIQGVIEFDLTGKIIAVNDNFAHVTGYSEKEMVGNHHGMFVEASNRSSHEYKAFWESLAKGVPQAGQFKRIAKGGAEIWLQASYNPILDMNGKPFKVVKYATDITEQYKNAAALAEAVEETQVIIESAKTGDLTSRVPLDGKTGAIASLCDGVNALMDKMTEVIVQVREAGETINTAAGEISSGNSDLSSRTEQQASSLEETASSMEELASTVKQNAENAKQANQLAVAASGVAVKGGSVVNQVTTTMVDINTSSRKIVDIISVIDGIAFQTNILALNAAVEAARAGEQGRGFAVVAGEVRNLAQRSGSAAKEIKELISDSVSKVEAGTKLVEDAGKTMGEIVSSVQRVTDIMGEITAASVEQSAGIDQVNDAITSMDEVTQQNAALVEQAAAAAESLVDQAVSLMEVVSAFQLSGDYSMLGRPNLRTIVKRPAERITSSKPVAKPVIASKTGTHDSEWEEF